MNGDDAQPADEAHPTTEDTAEEGTDLPGLTTWPSVYLLVVIVFAVYVVLLVALQKAFA